MKSTGTTLALLGASGHGKVVADAALAAGWERVLFFDDAWPARTSNGPWPVVGDSAALMARAHAFDAVVVAIGNCEVRLARQRELQRAGLELATVVHPGAWVSPFAALGVGTVVMAGAVVNPDAALGEAVIVNTCASVDHDCVVGNGAHISVRAALSGNVAVGEHSWIGAGATVRQGIRIGAGAMVGAGAAVVKDVLDGVTVVGVPARPLRAPRENKL